MSAFTVSDSRSTGDGFKSALAVAGYFDVVINDAGGGRFGPAEHLSNKRIQKQFQTLLFDQLQLMRQCRPSDKAGTALKVH
jgi:NAD(P)-dependent dehydrogenase (short-subunit alcohol dehydrogenase family)